MHIKPLIGAMKLLRTGPVLSISVCACLAATLGATVAFTSGGRDEATPTPTPTEQILADADVSIAPTITAEMTTEIKEMPITEPDTADDELEFGEFIYTPYLSGFIRDGEDEPVLPPYDGDDPDAVTTTTEPVTTTAPTTTTAPVTTTTKPQTTTKKPATTKKPETTVDKPAPDVSGITGGAGAIVEVAKSQVGTKEKAYNNVKYNTWYYGKEVRDKNSRDTSHAWCVVFISWCANKAGVSTDVVPKTAGVGNIMNFYKNKGLYKTRVSGYVPRAGDVVIFNGGSHAGLVVACDGSTVTVVEGNYSDSVALNTYKITNRSISGYGTPDYK